MAYQFKGKHFDEFAVGDRFVTASRTVTEADVVSFAGVSGDFNPLHTDEIFAKATPFGTRIAHGMLVLSIASGLANQLGIFEGTTIALMEQRVRYTGAVRFGDTVRLEMEVESKKETKKPDRGVITFKTTVLNHKDEGVIEGEWTLMMKAKPLAG